MSHGPVNLDRDGQLVLVFESFTSVIFAGGLYKFSVSVPKHSLELTSLWSTEGITLPTGGPLQFTSVLNILHTCAGVFRECITFDTIAGSKDFDIVYKNSRCSSNELRECDNILLLS